MKFPDHGNGQDKDGKIREDVAKPMDIGDDVGFDGTRGRRLHVEVQIEARADRPTGEDFEKECDGAPD